MSSIIFQPSVAISIASARVPIANTPQRVLICAQSFSTGTAADKAWTRDIGNNGEESVLFGRASMISEMIRAFKRIAPQVALDAIGVRDSGSGVKRVVGTQWSGTATAAGTVRFRVGSERQHTIDVPIASGTTAATALATAAVFLNLDVELPFDVTVVSTTLTFTAKHAGTVPNDLGIEMEASIAGLTFGNLIQSVAGSVDPTLTALLDVVGQTRYQGIVWAWPLATTVLTDFLEPRWNVTDKILDGVGFTAKADTFGGITGVTQLGDASKNAKTLVYVVDEIQAENGYVGPAINEPSYVKATMLAAIRALRLTTDAPISRYLTTPAPLDQYGGPALASLPYFNTLFPDLSVPRAGRGFTGLDIEAIKNAGGTIIGQDPSGSGAIAGEVVTTYVTNGAGIPDVTFQNLEYVDTASQVREYFSNNLRARFAQSRLTEGETIARRDMANAGTIRTFLRKLYGDLAGDGFVLVQGGDAAVTFFDDHLDIAIDMALGKVTITMDVPIVTQLRSIVATMTVAFSTAG